MKRVPREWAEMEYFDPEVVLPRLRQVREQVADSDTSSRIRNLRTNRLKRERESWDAAIFCQLLSLTTGHKILFSRVESSDYDSIFFWNSGAAQNFAPVQLKELASHEQNPQASISDVVHSLAKYPDSKDLVVGVRLNRTCSVDLSTLDTSNLRIGELWMYGITGPAEAKWSLFGDFMTGNVQCHEFELPYV
jgi:hypothetical protein